MTIQIKAATAYAMFDIAQSCAGRKVDRAVLEAVRVYTRDGQLIMAAADGFRLAEVTAYESDGEIDTLIPIGDVLAAIKAIKPYLKAPHVLVTISDNAIVVRSDNGEARLPFVAVDGTFPNYPQLIPPKRDAEFSRFAVDGRYLAEIGKAAGSHAASGIVRIQPGRAPDQPIRADFTAEDYEATIVLMPMFVDW